MFAAIGSDRERRGFEYFYHQIGKDLLDALRLDALRQVILQLSHSDLSIKEAVVALGSIGERLQINGILTRDNQEANACHEFAIEEYCKSLKHLRQQLQHDPSRTHVQTLVACLLFTVFEFLQGSEMGSLTHLRSGLNILNDIIPLPIKGSMQLEAFIDTENDTIVTRLPDHVAWRDDRLVAELVHTFTVVENQAIFWLGLESWDTRPLMSTGIRRPRPKHTSHFPTIEDAIQSLNYNLNRAKDLRNSFIALSSVDEANNLNAQRLDLSAKLQQWLIAVDELEYRIGNGWDQHTELRFNLMKMNHCHAIIMIGTMSEQPNVLAPEALIPAFADVVLLAKKILFPLDENRLVRIHEIVLANNREVPNVMFSFYIGLIQPLFVTASKCPDAEIAEEAVRLLCTSPWREGASESSAMGTIASRKRKRCEEMSIEILKGLKMLRKQV